MSFAMPVTTSIVSPSPSFNISHRALRLIPQAPRNLKSFTPCLLRRPRRHVIMAVNGSVESAPPTPSPVPTGRKGWIVGVVLTMLLPLFKNKWAPFLLFKDKFDTGLHKVDDTVEIIEKVAEELDKVAEDLSSKLPDGKLKNTVVYFEHAAEEAAKDLKLVDGVIHKLQELEEEADEYVKSRSEKPSEEVKIN